jgi:AdoMet-dependent heme synthase
MMLIDNTSFHVSKTCGHRFQAQGWTDRKRTMDIMQNPQAMRAAGAPLDFSERPYIVIWEVTQACDLACVHYRACAQPLRSPLALSTLEAKRLMDQVREMQVAVFILTGGDPLKRPDIYDLVEYASCIGLRPSLSPSATPLLTREAIAELKRRVLVRLAISLDGSTPALHDAFRGVTGTYARALEAVRWARELGSQSRSTAPSHGATWRTSRPWRGCSGHSTSSCGACFPGANGPRPVGRRGLSGRI